MAALKSDKGGSYVCVGDGVGSVKIIGCKQSVKRNLQTESQIPSPSEWLGMHS